MICSRLYWSFEPLTHIDWSDLARTGAAMATAGIAFRALQNWRRQDKAKREAEFLDELIEATHAYVAEIGRPVAMVDMARIGMRSYGLNWDNDDDAKPMARDAIAYITAKGELMSKRMLAALNELRPKTVQLRALATKGQVFSFADYNRCHDATVQLCWHFDRIEAFAAILSSSTWNWDNPEVSKTLDGVLTITADDIRRSLAKHNVVVLQFAQDTYRALYR